MSLVLKACEFETERLLVKEWHSLSFDDWHPRELEEVVVALLTRKVTRSLPAAWQGEYTGERARQWISERDREGTTLLVIDRAIREPVGLVILFETELESGGIEVRLGYLLSEDVWGRGIASELVGGFASWCRGQNSVSRVSAGVGENNPASMRVLEKAGFHRVEGRGVEVDGEQVYHLNLR